MPSLKRKTPAVLLWDIDGTLLRGAQAAIKAWWLAAQAEFDHDLDWRKLDASGATDTLIAEQICTQAGKQAAAAERLIIRYLQELPTHLQHSPPQVLHNAEVLLSYVDECRAYTNLFLTGNLRAAARAKLVYCGLGRFAWNGAFSEHGREREAVAATAKGLAIEACGNSVPLVVIGDTPRDVRAARAIDAYVITVATGSFSIETLAEYEPDVVLEQLPDPEDFVDLVERILIT